MSRAYYNENDEFAAAWLRNLIKAGLIADGEVDTRSIVDVRPSDLAGFTQCHFFAGIGGWSYALRKTGWNDSRPAWTGSCPCQPFSLAGAQRGFADERHLWPVWRELIRECSPAVVFGEQVASATAWLGLVRGDLEALGYAVGALPIQAASAGADHLRDRYWFVAHADDTGSQGRRVLSERASEWAAGADGMAYADCERGQVDQNAGGRKDGSGAGSLTGFSGHRDGDVPYATSQQMGATGQPRQHGGLDLADANCDGARDKSGDGASPQEAAGQRTRQEMAGAIDASRHDGAALEWVIGADGKARRVKPGIRLLAHGVSNRVGKLRGFGNAIDPRPAAAFIEAYMTSQHSQQDRAEGQS